MVNVYCSTCSLIIAACTADNVLDQSHLQPTNQPIEDTAERRSRLPSVYIRQMAEAKLLIPFEQVKLLDSVGQGTLD